MTSQTYAVVGLTCGHCAHAVTDEITALQGVTGVDIDLVVEGTLTLRVTSETALPDADVAAALDQAGDYRLTQD